MLKNIVHFILFTASVIYFISCSSSEDVKYNLLSKTDMKNIDSFCVCSAPYIKFWDRAQNLKDSSEALKYLDSMGSIMNKFTACTEILKTLNADKKNEKEFNAEMLKYIKVNHPEYYEFLTEKKKKN